MQRPERRPAGQHGWWWLLATLPAMFTGSVLAQSFEAEGGAAKRAWTIEPRVGASANYTDNVALSAVNQREELIGEVTPGIRVRADTASLLAYLDYQLRELIYRSNSTPSETQNNLNAFGRLEAIDDRFFIDFNGDVSQQSISAFGLQEQGAVNLNPNRTETRTFRVSPQLTGKLVGYLDYDLRYNAATTRTDAANNLNDTDTGEWSALLGGATPFSMFAWNVAGSAQQVDYANRQRSESDRLSGRLTWQPAAQYKLWITGGSESNNFASIAKRSTSTHGGGFEWLPGPRTQLLVARERRFFGDDDTLSLSHRTGRTVWKLDHTRSVSNPTDQFATASVGSVYDLLDAQLASQFPDATDRATEVERVLAASGLPRDATVTAGFLTSRVFLQEASTVSVLLAGRRNTITLTGTRTERESLATGLLGDDFDNFERIRQTGYSVTWARTVSRATSLSLSASFQRNTGEGAAPQATELRALQAGLQTRLGGRTTLGGTVRRTESEAGVNPYAENAATLTITQRF